MEQQFDMMAAMDRRRFFALTGLGAIGAMAPQMAWAKALSQYPVLQAHIDEYIAGKKASGIVASIGLGNKAPDILAKGTLALGSTVAVDANSLFRVYSMTKPITGIAAMMLVEEGKIKLDQPIADFLPEFANMRVLTDPEKSMDSVPAKTQITLRHLLTHTAGLGYSIITKGPLLQAYLDNGIVPGAISRMKLPDVASGAPVPDIKTFSQRLGTLPLIAEPGTKWSYSIGLDLAGHLIDVISGMEFGSFLQQRIFDPLKMNSSYFQVPQSEIPRLTTNYGVVGDYLIPIDKAASSIYLDKPAFAFGGAGLVTSAHDYDRFLNMLMNFGTLGGTRIIKSETAKLAMSNLLPATVNTKGSMADGAGFGAGARVGLGKQAGTYGWGGAAGTNAFVDSIHKIRAVGMVQYMPSNAQGFQHDFPSWVAADLMKKK